MIGPIWQYSRDEIVPRWGRIMLQPQMAFVALEAYLVHRYAAWSPLASIRIGEFTAMLLTYSAIAFGFCIAGLALVLTLPSPSFVSMLMKHKLSGQRQNSYSDLLFVFSWTAIVHWIAVVLSLVAPCIRRSVMSLLSEWDGQGWLWYVGALIAVSTYALIQFLLTVITLSQVGRLYVREFEGRRESGHPPDERR
jgi:hypothetical protein